MKKKLLTGLAALTMVAANVQCAPIISHPQTQQTTPTVNITLENRLFEVSGIRVLILEGTPYEKGYIRGKLLGGEIREAGKNLMDYAYAQVPMGEKILPLILDYVYAKLDPHIPQAYKEELRGLSDGSGVPLKQLQRAVAIPTLYSNIDAKLLPLENFLKKFKRKGLGLNCSSFAAWGKATKNGNLYMIRNLDWATGTKIYNYPLISVYKEEGFVNIGYVGMIGILSGMNLEGITIGEIGALTKDYRYDGIPMIYLLREVLEKSDDLGDVVKILTNARRDSGFNYIFGDGEAKEGVAVETTASLIDFFVDNDAKEHKVPYAIPIEDVVLRSDTAINQEIRKTQLCSGGYPNPPSGAAYTVRYVKAANLILENYGKIDENVAMIIAEAIAPDSNIQSVIYSPSTGEFWVANATDSQRAARNKYVYFSMKELFSH